MAMQGGEKFYVDIDATTDKFRDRIRESIGVLDGFDKKVASILSTTEGRFMAFGAASVVLSVTAGRALARLQDRYESVLMPLRNLSAGQGEYNRNLGALKRIADETGQSFLGLTDSYKNIYAAGTQAGYSGRQITQIFESVTRAGASLKLGNEQVSLTLRAVEQMISKQTIMAEELRLQLGDHIPGAYALMAKAAKSAGLITNGTTAELNKLMEQGKLASNVVLPHFAKELDKAFGKDAQANLETINGSANRLTDQFHQLVLAFNESSLSKGWAAINNGIADTMKALRGAIQSKEFGLFFGMLLRADPAAFSAGTLLANLNTQSAANRSMSMEDLKKEIANRKQAIAKEQEFGDEAFQKNFLAEATTSSKKVLEMKKSLQSLEIMYARRIAAGEFSSSPMGQGEGISNTISKLKDLRNEIAQLNIELLGNETVNQRLAQITASFEAEKAEYTSLLDEKKITRGQFNEWLVLREQKLQKDLLEENKKFWDNIKELQIRQAEETEYSRKMGLAKGLIDILGIDIEESKRALEVNKENLDNWIGDLQNYLRGKVDQIQPVKLKIEKLIEVYGDEAMNVINDLKQSIGNALFDTFSFLGDTMALGFEAILNPNVSFKDGFNKLLNNYLKGLGELMMRIGQELLVAAILKNITEQALANLGANAIPLAISLIAAGAAMKGGGMALSTPTESYSGSSRNFGGYGSGFGMSNMNIQVTGVLVAEGTQLKAVINNTSNLYG